MEFYRTYQGEQISTVVDFVKALPPGAGSIVSASLVAHEVDASGVIGLDVSNTFLQSLSCDCSGTTVKFRTLGGVASKRYRVKISAVTNDGQIVIQPIYFYSISI